MSNNMLQYGRIHLVIWVAENLALLGYMGVPLGGDYGLSEGLKEAVDQRGSG